MRIRLVPVALLVAGGLFAFACGPSKKPPPKEPAVTETVTDAGVEDASDAEPAAEKSLYERLGRKEAIAKIVDTFLKNVAADNKINKRFAKLGPKKMEDFKQKLVDQICEVSGGDCTYTGKPMKEAHKGMKIKKEEWDALLADLKFALEEHKVEEREQGDLISLLGPLYDDIVEIKPKK